MFRPKANFARLQRSAARLGLPVSFLLLLSLRRADVSLTGTRRSCCLSSRNCLLSVRFAKGDLSPSLPSEAPLVPGEDGGNLYIRPNIVETSEGSVIQQAPLVEEALLFIVTSANFGKKLYPSAESPEQGLRLDANTNYIRAWPGGTGSYKLGANYGGFPVRLVHKADQQDLSVWRRRLGTPCLCGFTERRTTSRRQER